MTQTGSSRIKVSNVLVRRVNRVRGRWNPQGALLEHPTVDEMFDDFFVLWRAFETTFDRPTADHRLRAERATVFAIEYEGIAPLPGVVGFGKALRHLHDADERVLRGWFGEDNAGGMGMVGKRDQIARVLTAAEMPARWEVRDSRSLAHLIYDVRCAVFHSTLETSNTVAVKILPRLVEAMCDLVVARAALQAGARIHLVQGVFNRELEG